ncbi:MAG: phosphotransferase [Proteobacteria bacterium]|nr:phosphotransferase [Pseudomonadota bacterium]
MSDREALIADFLASADWGKAERGVLADDASFRRYDRLIRGDERAVLMDAPPPMEDVRPFIHIDRLLRGMGLSAPEILAEDVETGLLLLEDFGDNTYTRALAEGGNEAALYELALDLLIELHRRFEGNETLPPYDDEAFLTEATLLTDWYMPAVNDQETPAALREEYCELWLAALAEARRMPATLVLRDYHVDNMIWLPERPGVAACGLLDFQDARLGPITYDLVSLFEDARRDVPPALTAKLLERYLDAFPELDRGAFAASYAIMGVQRSAKILGIFTRLDRRDGKPGYLPHIPRVWRWLEGDLEHPALADLRAWFERALPRQARVTPEPGTRT